jgi:hypothetical protein
VFIVVAAVVVVVVVVVYFFVNLVQKLLDTHSYYFYEEIS